MKRRSLIAILTAGLLLGGCGDGPAVLGPDSLMLSLRGSSPKFTDFSAREAICELGPPEIRETGRFLHIVQRVTTRAESEDPRYTGTNIVDTRVRLDPATGTGRAFGRFSFRPDEVQGSWEGTFEGAITTEPETGVILFSGPGVARGTGELQSQTLRVHYATVVADPEDHPCLPDPAAAGTMFIESVRIIDPNS